MACFLFTVLLIGLTRRALRGASALSREIIAMIPVVWAWSALFLLNINFAQLSGFHLEALDPTNPTGSLLVVASHPALMVASGSALLVLPMALVPVAARKWVAVCLVLLSCLLAFADLLYLRYFGNILPLVALPAAHQVGQLRESIGALATRNDLLLLPFVLAAAVFAVSYHVPGQWPRRRRLQGLAVSGAVFLSCAWASSPAAAALTHALHQPTEADFVYTQTFWLRQWGVVNTHLFDVIRTIREWRLKGQLTLEDRQRIQRFFAERAREAPPKSERFGLMRGHNLIMIQVESLQEWVVGAQFNGQEIMPFLSRLRQQALYVPYLFDQTGEGRTADAEFAVLNSLHPLSRGAVAVRCPYNHFVALPELFKRAGYTTLSAHAFAGDFWNRALLHPRYGFEHSLFRNELTDGASIGWTITNGRTKPEDAEQIGWGLADHVFFKRMVPRLSQLPRPFFAFLITLGLHYPYKDFPLHHKVLQLVGLERMPSLANYLHAMHYIDMSLKQFFQDLEAAGLLKESVVALYGDHDAGLPINIELVHLAGYEKLDPSLPMRIDRVPFFILAPGDRLQGAKPAVGGQVDIAPTLLDLFGLERPMSFIGQTLLAPGSQRTTALMGGNAVTQDRLFVAGSQSNPNGDCFAFPSGDPLSEESCQGFPQRARDELHASELAVLHDLAKDLASIQP